MKPQQHHILTFRLRIENMSENMRSTNESVAVMTQVMKPNIRPLASTSAASDCINVPNPIFGAVENKKNRNEPRKINTYDTMLSPSSVCIIFPIGNSRLD